MMQNVASDHRTHYAGSHAQRSYGNDTVSAQNFRNAIAGQQNDSRRNGGDSFLANLIAAADPQQKLAMIEGFAAGYANAMNQSGNTLRYQPVSSDAPRGVSQSSDLGGTTSSRPAEKDPQAVMDGFRVLSEQIANSDLPTQSKNSMLEDIARQMAKLRDENPPSKTADNGTDSSDSASKLAANSSADGSSDSSASPTSGQEGKVWTQENKDGVATIHLGDEYTLKVNENGAAVTISNNWTGGVTNIWGDPHIDVGNDGTNDFNFKDGMTMKLDNGIELRLGTLMDGDVSFATSLTILQGDRAMQVTGIAGDRDGKNNLSIVQSNEGRALANLTPNGAFVIQEAGKGWQTTGGNALTQQFITDSETLYEGRKQNKA